eukprot:5512520-Amphidinium_carterae.1
MQMCSMETTCKCAALHRNETKVEIRFAGPVPTLCFQQHGFSKHSLLFNTHAQQSTTNRGTARAMLIISMLPTFLSERGQLNCH